MITGISIENFKGIAERVDIDLRPLTLLFGANSAGKSSIIHALHYAREVFVRRNLNADLTESGGESIDLGGFRNFVNLRDSSRAVRLQFDLDISQWTPFPYIDVFDHISAYMCVPVLDLALRLKRASIKLEIGFSKFHNALSVRRYEVALNGVDFVKIVHNPDQRTTAIANLNSLHPALTCPRDSATVDADAEELEALEELHDIDRPFLDSCLEYVRELFPYTGDGTIPLVGMTDALPDFDTIFPLPGDMNQSTHLNAPVSQRDVLAEIRLGLTQLIVGPGRLLREGLEGFRYLGPIRAVPPRNYDPPKTDDPSRWATGLGAWDLLATADSAFVDDVSHWLGDDNRLNSGYRLRQKRFKELDLSDPLVAQLITGRAFDDTDAGAQLDLTKLPTQTRVSIIPTGSSIELRPSDVGIGISQVVPVVVTALEGNARLVAIEQPELHLHPAIQVAIGDLLIAGIQDGERTLLVETHSEHLLLRLLRRVRETSSGELPEHCEPVNPDQISIFFVESIDGAVRVRPLTVTPTGDFAGWWPEGFFDERTKELM